MARLTLALIACLAVAACARTVTPPRDYTGAQYWQRAGASDSAYTQGPKAQDMLARDIARCVAELRELERLGMLHGTIPADPATGRLYDPDDPRRELADWEAPDRTGFLRMEQGQYHDFEGCMAYRGWERVKYLPYDTVARGQEAHTDALWDARHPADPREPWQPAPPAGGYRTSVNE
jgi:hypothetical protein